MYTVYLLYRCSEQQKFGETTISTGVLQSRKEFFKVWNTLYKSSFYGGAQGTIILFKMSAETRNGSMLPGTGRCTGIIQFHPEKASHK